MTQPPDPRIDTSVPHSARIWGYWLGGKDYYEADREAGDAFAQVFPDIRAFAQSSRGFLTRAVRTMASECGLRQFLDVGAGLPSVHNTHEIAQRIAPASRVVYVDHDPVVLLHVGALLTSSPEGATDYVDADMRDTQTLLHAAARTLDLTQPTGLIFSDVLGHITDLDDARALVARLVEAMPAGSYLALSHATPTDPTHVAAQAAYNATGAIPYILREPHAVSQFFDGLEMLPPGLVAWPQWRPDPDTPAGPPSAGVGALARIP